MRLKRILTDELDSGVRIAASERARGLGVCCDSVSYTDFKFRQWKRESELPRYHTTDVEGRKEGRLERKGGCVRSENRRSKGNLLGSSSPKLEEPTLPPVKGREGDDGHEDIIDILLDVCSEIKPVVVAAVVGGFGYAMLV
jgi:hypothetical protein